jgi:hypothetical protein
MDDYEVRLNILMYSEYCQIKNSFILATESGVSYCPIPAV